MLDYLNIAVNDCSVHRVQDRDSELGVIPPFLINPSLRTSRVSAGPLYPAMEKRLTAYLFSGSALRHKKNERPISNMRSFSWPLRFCLSLQGSSVKTRLAPAANRIRYSMCSSFCPSHKSQEGSPERVSNPSPVGISCGSGSAIEETIQFSIPSVPEQMFS